jgi:hypothetical protein
MSFLMSFLLWYFHKLIVAPGDIPRNDEEFVWLLAALVIFITSMCIGTEGWLVRYSWREVIYDYDNLGKFSTTESRRPAGQYSPQRLQQRSFPEWPEGYYKFSMTCNSCFNIFPNLMDSTVTIYPVVNSWLQQIGDLLTITNQFKKLWTL